MRTLPRPFSLHWGDGSIVEEATYAGEHHEPSLQLLEFDDGSLPCAFAIMTTQAASSAAPSSLIRTRSWASGSARGRAPDSSPSCGSW